MKRFNIPILFVIFLFMFSAIQCNKNDDIEPIPEDSPSQSIFKETVKTEKIGSSGGTIDLGNRVAVTVPTQALSVETHITVENINPFVFDEKPRFDGDGIYVSSVIICKPSGLTFSKPVKITIPYYDELIPDNYTINDFIVLGSNNNSWDTLAFTIDESKKTVIAETTHFSEFKIILDKSGNFYLQKPKIGINGTNNYLTIGYDLDYDLSGFAYFFKYVLNAPAIIYQEYWHEIGLFKKRNLATDEFIGGKQLYTVVVQSYRGESKIPLKGSKAEEKSLYEFSDFPNSARISSGRQIFNLTLGGMLDVNYGATNEVTFNNNKEVTNIQFRDIGKISNLYSFPLKLTTDNTNFNLDIARISNLDNDAKYYIKIRIQAYGKALNDYGTYHSTNFSLSELKTEGGLTLAENSKPTIQILSPANNSSFVKNQPITFKCNATDIEDGILGNDNFYWLSDINGYLGKGTEITTSNLATGTHQITVTAKDSDDNESSSTITISIKNDVNPPVVTFQVPKEMASGDIKISFTVTDPDMNLNDFSIRLFLSQNEYKRVTLKNFSAGEFDGELISNVPVGTHSFIWESKTDYPDVHDRIKMSMLWRSPEYKKVSDDYIFYINNSNIKIPLVETLPATNKTSFTAQLNGDVVTDGGGTIALRGFYWSDETNPYPYTTDNPVPVTGTTGEYNETITGLLPGKKYYFRAFVLGNEEAMMGDILSFTTPELTGTAPVADFTASATSIKKGETVTFTDKSQNNPTSWLWTFSDGQTSTQQHPTVQFNTVGNISVTLKATNNFGNNTKTLSNYITVSETGIAPIADFTASATSIKKGETLTFTDKSQNNPTSWLWTFSDGQTSTQQHPSIQFNTLGNISVTLKATNNFGNNTKTLSNYITVSEIGIAPVADFTASVTSIKKGETVTFTDKSQNSPTSWLWTFSDGQTSTLQHPTVKFNTVGNISVTLKATNNFGNHIKTLSNYITVSETGIAPVADFTVSKTSATVGETIQFTDNSSNAPTSWSWTFGDGATANTQNSTHSYSAANTYTATLKVSNNFGDDSKSITINVTNPSGETSGTFTDSRDGNTYKWVKIGEQVWMAKNLAFKTSSGSSAYNSESDVSTYGRLYKWETAVNACPSDWHLPTDEEWEKFAKYISDQKGPFTIVDDDWNDVGKYLKANNWWTFSESSNDFGFSGIPAGQLYGDGTPYGRLSYSYWWSSTKTSKEEPFYRFLGPWSSRFGRDKNPYGNSYSVRCIKD